jgi:hypothetical protein
MSAFGTAELGFADLMLVNIINAACDGGSARPPGEEDIRALAAVSSIGTRDEIEGMLAPQMVATHFAAMGVLRRLKGLETIPQQEGNGNLATKLLRTFTMQVEALQRYRGKGSRKLRSSTFMRIPEDKRSSAPSTLGEGARNRRNHRIASLSRRRSPQRRVLEWSRFCRGTP